MRAQEAHPRVQLRWQAPAECPDDLALLRIIEDFLGQPVSRAREQQITIDAHVMGDSSRGYAAKVAFATPTGVSERTLEHPDCIKVTEAAALLMALAIDPERVRALREASATREPSEGEPNDLPSPLVPAPQRRQDPAARPVRERVVDLPKGPAKRQPPVPRITAAAPGATPLRSRRLERESDSCANGYGFWRWG